MSTVRRLDRACDQCARRKIRCDRNQPCGPCVQRNYAHLCSKSFSSSTRRPSSVRVGHVATPEQQVIALRERLAAIEERLTESQSRPIQAFELQSTGFYDEAVYEQQIPEDLANVQSLIENLNLGLENHQSVAVHEESDHFKHVFEVHHFLPSYGTSKQIVHFSLTNLAWIHCALRVNVFLEFHEQFWEKILLGSPQPLYNSSWLALYFAVISTGLYYMDMDHECISLFSFYRTDTHLALPRQADETIALSKLWYQFSLSELTRADFMGIPRLISVQTIAVLTLVNNSFGQNAREYHFLGTAINMARTLDMHNLGTGSIQQRRFSAASEWQTPEQRALGRRLWWTLVICDWFGSMKNSASIQPHSFSSQFDPAADQDEVVLSINPTGLPGSERPSSLQYHAIVGKLSHIVRTYVKASRGASEANLASAMAEVDKICSDIPEYLRNDRAVTENTAERDSIHSWLPMQRYILTHVLQFIRLTIARASLGRWLRRQPDKNSFHRTAIMAAETIVAEKLRDFPPMYQKSWIVCAATIAAGVFLGLDLLCFGTGEGLAYTNARKHSITICITALEALGSSNAISMQGPGVLKRLLQLDSVWDHKSVPSTDVLQKIVHFISTKAEENASFELCTPSQSGENRPEYLATDTFPSVAENSLPANEHVTEDAFDQIFAHAAFDQTEFEMELFENPFDFTDTAM